MIGRDFNGTLCAVYLDCNMSWHPRQERTTLLPLSITNCRLLSSKPWKFLQRWTDEFLNTCLCKYIRFSEVTFALYVESRGPKPVLDLTPEKWTVLVTRFFWWWVFFWVRRNLSFTVTYKNKNVINNQVRHRISRSDTDVKSISFTQQIGMKVGTKIL
jgi:hypothetical protein